MTFAQGHHKIISTESETTGIDHRKDNVTILPEKNLPHTFYHSKIYMSNNNRNYPWI
jgi:hypothetical protein